MYEPFAGSHVLHPRAFTMRRAMKVFAATIRVRRLRENHRLAALESVVSFWAGVVTFRDPATA
jgi:hypothetical protein